MTLVLARADWRFRPWKNGGGEMADLAAGPAGAETEPGGWRISAARIDRSGPFSEFAGVDRLFTVIEGGPVELTVDGSTRRLDAAAPPFAFPGDAPCSARLLGPPALVLNLLTRRPLRAEVRRSRIGAPQPGRALLLEPAGGLSRLDLVDTAAAGPALQGATAILVTIGG